MRSIPGSAVQSVGPAGRRIRFGFAAGWRSRAGASRGSGTPVGSRPLTARGPASNGASSGVRPVSRLTTPAGRSEVASTSVRVTAGSGRSGAARTTAVLPVTITGASTLTRPSRLESGGATMPTTPAGSGEERLKNGPATGLAAPITWAILSAQPAYQTHRSIAASTVDGASPGSLAATSSTNWARRPSSSSAIRYRIWPRLYAVAPAHLGTAARAATTASRTSLREASAALARKAPSSEVTTYDRPDSLRGKAPPMNSLYVFGIRSRDSGKVALQTVAAAFPPVPGLLVAAER